MDGLAAKNRVYDTKHDAAGTLTLYHPPNPGMECSDRRYTVPALYLEEIPVEVTNAVGQ